MHILIAGGGIGGLTAALCLKQAGHSVTVLEQAEAFGEVGAGLQLSPNAMKVYRKLGLEDALVERGFVPEAAEIRLGESGQRLFAFPLAAEAEKRWGAPYLHIHRADLIDVLRGAALDQPDIALRTGAMVESYSQDQDTVAVSLVDGGEEQGDLLIGADGIHSAIRTQMLGADKPHFTGNVAWRGTVPIEALGEHAPDPNATIWLGRGKHVVTYRLRQGTLANFVGVVEHSKFRNESWSEEGAKAEALADFEGWHPIVTTMIEAAPRLFRWGLFGRPTLPKWSNGRVVLLGDACHPMLPFMAQGAAQAIEDAYMLGALLREPSDIEAALRDYEVTRKPRASRVQAVSKSNATLFHHRNPLMRLSTYGPMWMAGRLAPRAIMARQDWLYAHDVTR
ncbi:FAD-dependent monooxygenase [Hyphomonas sp. FCG-A18]|uniref:FAD-dependent monooxygenase n=1 Tax=Hyphomonas sp. FCG-A18 TaxID=3080019 RepID=UPI002B298923|nr:FAD-dependent monooxygenase [Hyphomonas sp. FCG-A18]